MAVPLFVLVNEHKRTYKRRKLLEHLTEAEVKKHTGLPSWGVREIIEIFEPFLTGQTSASIPVETKVLCYLTHLRSGSFQWCLGSLGGLSQPSASRIIEDCINQTLSLTPSVIKFPNTLDEINATKQSFAAIAGFPNILGLIDGTHIAIKAPTENEGVFVCRKQFHSLNTQVICGPDHSFFDIVAKWPGSTHDSFIYNDCRAKERIAAGEFGDGWLLGDSGYPLEPRLLTPYSTDDTEAKRAFNTKHKKTRTTVERAIGTWKSRFRALDKTGGTLCYKEGKCCKIIVAAATLHNICIKREIPLTEEDDWHLQHTFNIDLDDNQQGHQRGSRQTAAALRDRLAESFL